MIFSDNEHTENTECYMTKDEYIIEAKKILNAVMSAYERSYEPKEEEPCSCGGGYTIEGGEIVTCRTCNGDGYYKDIEFNQEKFTEEIEHGIILTDEFKFLEILKANIVKKSKINKIKKQKARDLKPKIKIETISVLDDDCFNLPF